MRPFVARIAGAGSVIVLALGTTVFTVQQRAEAASPVCFTVTGGDCYCVDFFLTMVKEQITSQAQKYINNLMGEHNDLKEMGVQEVGGQVGNVYTYDGLLDDVNREALSQPASQRPMPTGAGIPDVVRNGMERDPEGKTLMGRQSRAVASASAKPEELAPYTVSQSPSGERMSPESVLDWTDRMLLEPADISIPDDQALADMPMSRLLETYESVRHVLGASYSRYHLKELAASEQRLQALSKSREKLELDGLDQPGAIQSANLVADTLNLAIDAELLESQLRQESLVASLIAMRVGGAYEAQ